ncbi:MAG: HAD-IA family hydrolase [Lachnospiraceae bacterium]|nr:HAD-IA family hydrolase [Lachnospiraceae bacterium]
MSSRLYDTLSKYDLIIFDMDGTLYFQRGMQIRMAFRLISHAFAVKGGLKDLRAILKYRKLREGWDSSSSVDEDRLYSAVADDMGMNASRVRDVIKEWMLEKPMDVVGECRDEALMGVIKRLISDGKRVCIYSDYPTEDKCRAVGLNEDIPQYYCGKGEIKTLKPNPSALFYIMNDYPDIHKSRAVMVGDRADRDKACADSAGMDSIILARFRLLRR